MPPTAAAIERSGTALLAVIAGGEAVFLTYLLATYWRAAAAGDFAGWARLSAHGWVTGDGPGNTAMLLHIGLATLVLAAGMVQLLPTVRRRRPVLHRWSGRLYLSGCLVAATSGLWLVWGRGTVGGTAQHVAISLNAGLIALCAARTWQTARARRWAAHRAWAIRTFAVAGGVFYFRVLLATWLLLFRRPVGFDAETFSGPFLTALAFGAYVVGPLGWPALHAWASGRHMGVALRVVSGATWALTTLCAVGVVAAALVLWMPKM